MTQSALDMLSSLIDHVGNNESNHSALSSFPCICETAMKKIHDVALLYRGDGAICVNCGDEKCDIFWHCTNEYSVMHPDGYDICNNCAIILTQQKNCKYPLSWFESNGKIICDSCECQPVVGTTMYGCRNCNYDLCHNCHQDQKISRSRPEIKHVSQVNPTQVTQQRDILKNISVSSACNDEYCNVLFCFMQNMYNYIQNPEEFVKTVDKNGLITFYEDYLHLLHHHDNDEQIDSMFEALGVCPIATCTSFRRHYQNRMKSDDINPDPYQYNVACNMLDKMHCYFQHSYDAGYRLSRHEKVNICRVMNDIKDEENIFTQHTLNHEMQRINKIISIKREKVKQMLYLPNDKYNQLFTEDETKENKGEYSFGFEFEYGYCGEIVVGDRWGGATDLIQVQPRFHSIKDEVLSNDYFTDCLHFEQYEFEYKKAEIYLESSQYKNKTDNTWATTKNEYISEVRPGKIFEFNLEYLLALMIYSNYDKLQNQFTKTYRENKGRNHTYCYHLGKGLKIACNHFGTNIKDTGIHSFYHGIDQQLFFQKYIPYIAIYGPLSTTSSFAVAALFASGDGFILELKDKADYGIQMAVNQRCFPMRDLSDYPNEREYLFVQTAYKLAIENITTVSGTDYKPILTAAELIHDLVAKDEFMIASYENLVNVENSMWSLIRAILENELSNIFPNRYRPRESFTLLSSSIIKSFCYNCKALHINYWKLRKYASDVADIFVHCKYEWINLKALIYLFPMVQQIYVSHINLSFALFQDILNHLNTSSLYRIVISYPKPTSDITIKEILEKYSKIFKDNECVIYQDLRKQKLSMITPYDGKIRKADALCLKRTQRRDTIFIEKMSAFEFAMKTIFRMNELRYHDTNNEITKLAENLVENRLNFSNAHDAKQNIFNQECIQVTEMNVNWNLFSLNDEMYLYRVIKHLEIDRWIRVIDLMNLFPNMSNLNIKGVYLSPVVVKDILNIIPLMDHGLKLYNILMIDPVITENGMSIIDAVHKYKEAFAALNWSFEVYDENSLSIQKRPPKNYNETTRVQDI